MEWVIVGMILPIYWAMYKLNATVATMDQKMHTNGGIPVICQAHAEVLRDLSRRLEALEDN